MTGFEQLEQELVAAAGRRASARRLIAAFPRLEIVGLAVLLGLTGLVAGVLLISLHGHAARTSSGRTAAPSQPTPCSYSAGRASSRRLSNAKPDPRLSALLGVLRRSPSAADSGHYATCAAMAAEGPVVDQRFVRYLAPGITGGSVFLVPVSGNRREYALPAKLSPSERARALKYFTSPAVCLVTVGYVGTMSGVGGCFPLTSLQRGFSQSHALPIGSTEIVNATQEQQALKRAGFPPSIRRGSIVSALLPNHVSKLVVRYGKGRPFTVPVRDNYAQFHTLHSAPVAVRAAITVVDSHGRVLGGIGPG